MKFALLGWAPEGLPFLRAVTADSRHSLVAAAEVPDEGLGRLLETAPGIRVLGDWDELLLDAAADVTLVAGASEATLAGARQLAVDGRPLALLPQAGQGSAFIYELSLTHDDNQVPLVPIPRLEVHPLSRQLKRLVETGELGQLILLRLERKIPSRQPTAGSSPHGGSVEPGSSVSLTAGEVDAAFLDDVALLRYLAGNFNRITAVHSGSDDTQITLATITLGGDELAEATWTAQRGHPAWQLEVTGTDASATLTLSSDWSGTLETAGGSDAHGTDGGGSDAGGSDARGTDGGGSDADGSKPAADSEWKSARDAKHSSVGTGVLEAHDTTSRVDDDDGASLGAAQLTAVEESLKKPVSAWTELTRNFEIVDAVGRSLRRRRTIDL